MPQRLDGCQMHISALQPAHTLDDPPYLEFNVPAKRTEEWHKRVRDSLRHIATCLS